MIFSSLESDEENYTKKVMTNGSVSWIGSIVIADKLDASFVSSSTRDFAVISNEAAFRVLSANFAVIAKEFSETASKKRGEEENSSVGPSRGKK